MSCRRVRHRRFFRILYPPLLLALSIVTQSCSPLLGEAISESSIEESWATPEWEIAANVVPPALMEQVVQDNLTPTWIGDPGRMKAIKVSVKGQAYPLYVINPQITPPRLVTTIDPSLSPLCGTAGCKYLAYIEESGKYRQIFDKYLKDKLPPDIPFLRVAKSSSMGLPCLEFTQYPDPLRGTTLISTRYCYNGQSYVPQETSRKSVPQPTNSSQ